MNPLSLADTHHGLDGSPDLRSSHSVQKHCLMANAISECVRGNGNAPYEDHIDHARPTKPSRKLERGYYFFTITVQRRPQSCNGRTGNRTLRLLGY